MSAGEDVFLEDALNQLCVYWAPGAGGDEGQKTFAEPVEITCRWEMVVEAFLNRQSGNPEQSRSKVFLSEDVEELGVLWLPPISTDLPPGGAISQLESEDEPFENDGAFEIRRFDKIPNFDADEWARIAYL